MLSFLCRGSWTTVCSVLALGRVRAGRSEQAHEMPGDPGVSGSTPFRIGEDADSDYPLGIEDDGSLPL